MFMEHMSEGRAPEGLSVSACSAGPRLVVVVVGEADWATADRLREGLAAALAYGPRSMVLDLTDLVFCSLHGVRALLAAVETAERAGVDVTWHGVSRQLEWLYDFVQAGRGTPLRPSRSGVPGAGSRRAAVRRVSFA